jgi:hypothetical protein
MIDAIAPTNAPLTPVSGAGVDESTAGYLAAGERAAMVMDVVWKVCVGLFVLLALAWALGVLPVAVRLF